jgi:hypothetical protein
MASSGFRAIWRYRNIEAPPAAATPAPVSTDDDHDDFSLAGELDDEAPRCEELVSIIAEALDVRHTFPP